jgi:hypothetical protein
MFERLTRWENNDKDVADLIEGKSDFDGLTEAINRLAAYEDSELSPDEVQELAKAKADGRLKILPAKPGDIIYRPEALQFCWVITKVEIYEDEIVFIDDSDNIFRPDDIGKTVFLSREAAEKALGVGE